VSAAPQLRRVVSRWEVVALAINDVIGSGVYLLPASAAALLGAASPLAVLVAGFAVLLIVLCFAEAASLFDTPGSGAVYAREAFGEFAGWQVGWMTWLARVASVGSLSAGFAQALGALWPAAASEPARSAVIVALIVVLGALNVIGVKAGARAASLLALAKLLPLVALIACGAFAIEWSRFENAARPSLAGLREAALLLLFAYAGFENTAAAAGEHRDPRRDVPFALLVQMGVVTALYALVQLVVVGVLEHPERSASPLADAMGELTGPVGAALLGLGALVSIAGTNAGTILAGPRYLYVIAHSGALPARLARIHPRFHTPHLAIVAQCVASLPLALTGSFAELAALSVIARLTTYVGTAGAVIVLRRRMPASARSLRLPLGPAIPLAAIAVCVVLASAATRANLIAGGLALTAGGLLWALRRRAAALPPPPAE
jgi:amino acid transporter